ncbi:hypothetical protein [Echinicola rosea]|uniref:SGNH/GDSL hydrolase family protein n=1 Tax=Echinicola rosea TaxID=1807691 RepID=A0ABQ1VD22_9BACT|nr:hypothetical protein [Echinicola rosea]GGF51603.1 hypothetical protein GCM10011339_45160 [Echinicola rosea]
MGYAHYTDPFYLRFTSHKQKNLILGTSRAAQGLQPEIFKERLGLEIYNYSFTLSHSPYGKVYYESIVKKHNKEKNGVFILAVDPWSISSWCNDPNDLAKFRENELSLGITHNVNMYPNFEYLLKNLKGNYKDILLPRTRKVFLHHDGWLEIKDIPMDSLSVSNRINEKLYDYRNKYLLKTKYSKVRYEYLLKIINYLSDYGEVYLVRLPVHFKMMEIEEELMPNFNNTIKDAIKNSQGYLDLTEYNSRFKYTDGNHLHKSSGIEVSQLVANWIEENKGNR